MENKCVDPPPSFFHTELTENTETKTISINMYRIEHIEITHFLFGQNSFKKLELALIMYLLKQIACANTR